MSGLGFCHGKKYFCQDSGKKPVKTGNNWQQLAKSFVHKIEWKYCGLMIMQHLLDTAPCLLHMVNI